VDLNKELKFKNTAKIRKLRPNVISFQGFPSEATTSSYELSSIRNLEQNSFCENALRKTVVFPYTSYKNWRFLWHFFYSFQELDVCSFVQYLTKHCRDRQKAK